MPFQPSRRLVAVAFGAVAASLAAVYVTERGDVESGGRCAAAPAAAAALKPLATGALAALSIGERPIDLSDLPMATVDGTAGRLGELAGRTLLVNLWATWCVPCRTEMPHLQALQAARGGDRFSVVALNVDAAAPGRASRFLAEIGATGLIDRRDPDMAGFDRLKTKGLVLGLPTTLLVDADGCVLATLAGAADWASPEALALIDAAQK